MKAFSKLVEYFGQVKERWNLYERNSFFVNNFAALCTEDLACFSRRSIKNNLLTSANLLSNYFNKAAPNEQNEIRHLFNENFFWIIDAPAFRAPAEAEVDISVLKLVKNSSLAVTPLHLLLLSSIKYDGVNTELVDLVFSLTTNAEAFKVPVNKEIEREFFPQLKDFNGEPTPINLMLYGLPEVRAVSAMKKNVYMMEKLLERLDFIDLNTKKLADIFLSNSFKYEGFDSNVLLDRFKSLYEAGVLNEKILLKRNVGDVFFPKKNNKTSEVSVKKIKSL